MKSLRRYDFSMKLILENFHGGIEFLVADFFVESISRFLEKYPA